MPTKQTLWQLVVGNPFLQFAAVVTILVGLLTICERIGKFAVSMFHACRAAFHWFHDRKLFRYMTIINPKSLYEVKELAEALHRSQTQISRSLHRLQVKQKVRRFDANEAPGGLWGIHEFQQ